MFRVQRGVRRGLASAAKSAETSHAWLGMDIGGSLTKVAVYEAGDVHERVNDTTSSFIRACVSRFPRHPGFRPDLTLSTERGTYSFLSFETRWMPDFLEIAASMGAKNVLRRIKSTGGGAYKFADSFLERLGVELEPVGEMEALAKGYSVFRNLPEGEVYRYDLDAPAGSEKERVPVAKVGDGNDESPSLLVSIGSGVSLIRVGSGRNGEEGVKEENVERVNGCSIGGATFWGLCRLMTSYDSFDTAIEAAGRGDNDKVAMLVRDIYGGGVGRLGLPGDIVASDFGKVAVRHNPRLQSYSAREPYINDADLVRGLIVLVTNNIAQVAFMTAEKHDIDNIIFTGSFLREGLMMRTLTSALKFWSAGSMTAGFMKHEAFFGAMGALKSKGVKEE